METTKNRNKATETLAIDIMLHDRFVCTLRYKYCPLFAITEEELTAFVESNRPSLKGKDYRICF